MSLSKEPLTSRFGTQSYMPGTAEVDRYRTDSGLWYGLTGGSQVRKFMSRMGQKKTFPYPSENGPGATMVAVDQSRRLGPKTWAVYLRISRFAGRLFGVIKALELISFECLHCYFLMVVLVIFQSLSVTRCEKSRFSNELRLVFMGLAFENAN